VLEFDIKGAFDHVDHELMMKAVRQHARCTWVELYVERWLKAPMILRFKKFPTAAFCFGHGVKRNAAKPRVAFEDTGAPEELPEEGR
jgi:retron-type reverse transcriptase